MFALIPSCSFISFQLKKMSLNKNIIKFLKKLIYLGNFVWIEAKMLVKFMRTWGFTSYIDFEHSLLLFLWMSISPACLFHPALLLDTSEYTYILTVAKKKITYQETQIFATQPSNELTDIFSFPVTEDSIKLTWTLRWVFTSISFFEKQWKSSIFDSDFFVILLIVFVP